MLESKSKIETIHFSAGIENLEKSESRIYKWSKQKTNGHVTI